MHRTDRAAGFLICCWVALLPVQFEVGTLGLPFRLAPSDLALAGYLLVRLPRLRHVPRAWSSWLLALPPVMGLGMLVVYARTGALGQYAYLQKGFGLLLLLAAFCCLVDHVDSWDRLRRLLRVFVVSVVVNALVAVVAFVPAAVGGPVLPLLNEPYPGVRLTGLLIDPNAFGGLVSVALLVVLVTARPVPLLGGVWRWAAGPVLAIALLLTFSRSAWIGFACGVLVLGLCRPLAAAVPLRRLAVGGFAAVPLLAVALFAVVPDAVRMIQRPDQVQSRVDIIGDAMAEFVTSPVVGIGIGGYEARHGLIVHNTVLWFLTELGLVGLLVLLGLLWSVGSRLLAAHRLAPTAERTLVLGLLAGHASMVGLSMGIEAFYQRHWWLVMALGAAAWVLCTAPPRAAGADPQPAGADPWLVRGPAG
ncbi:O-antigen ligase family protein [Pseudonocardia nematodicida]|uniref:O-antigen ligase family protein n=1 Tax=Pseudonocardia nematodicida TaxID=1206997 RepID=A0ABV1K3R7_9PSEU